MTEENLPALISCAESWKYDEKWELEYKKQHRQSSLSKVCGHSSAEDKILFFITYCGERVITRIKRQNLFIKRILAGERDSWNSSSPTSPKENASILWQLDFDAWDELFELYNAGRAPGEILSIIREIKTLMDIGRSQCQAMFEFALAERVKSAQEQEARDREEAEEVIQEQRQANEKNSSKQLSFWDAVDITNSKVTDGFIYLLSNSLMPGIFKIGFTAYNPERRRRELVAQHALPVPFVLVAYWRTKDPYIVEQRIHSELSFHRKSGEFFEVDLQVAEEIIEASVIPV